MIRGLVDHLKRPFITVKVREVDTHTNVELGENKYTVMTFGAFYATYLFVVFAPEIYQLVAPYLEY